MAQPVLIFLVLYLPAAAALQAADPTETPQKKKLVNRTVLVLDTVNQTQQKDLDYLSTSIADSVYEQLQNTGKFEMLSRDVQKKLMVENGISSPELAMDSKVITLGKKARADVVVSGTYVVIGNTILIREKAVEIASERVVVQTSKQGKVDGTIFSTIASTSNDLAVRMENKLPPLPPKEIRIKEASRAGSFFRSMVLPGWGQYHEGQKIKGAAFMATSVALTGLAAYYWRVQATAYDEYMDLGSKTSQSSFDSSYKNYQDKQKTYQLLWIAAASIYMLSVGDLLLFGGGGLSKSNLSLPEIQLTSLAPGPISPQRDHNENTMGLSVSLRF